MNDQQKQNISDDLLVLLARERSRRDEKVALNILEYQAMTMKMLIGGIKQALEKSPAITQGNEKGTVQDEQSN